MKCSYCQNEIEKGTGIMYVRKTGALKYYCSKRCMKFDVKFKKKLREPGLKTSARKQEVKQEAA